MKKVLCISCLVAIFVACGDDNDNNVSTSHNAAEEPPKQEVSTIYELGVCGENNEMTSIFVTEENAYYFCNGVEWQKFLFESSSSILGAISSIVKSSSDIAIWSSSSQTNILGSSISLSSGVSSSIKKTVSSSSSSSEVELGILRDARDGQAYKTVVIGSQLWMAENLNYKTENSFCYGNKEENCTKYGRLYTLDSAIYACPDGWHLPTITEWRTLFSLDGETVGGKNLKTTRGWGQNSGLDSYGFSALPAGYGMIIASSGSTGFGGVGSVANFWMIPETKDYYIDLREDLDAARAMYYTNPGDDIHIKSVRCIKGKYTYKPVSSSSVNAKSSSSAALISPCKTETKDDCVYGTLHVGGSLYDKETYKTVTIGTQEWMAENLDIAQFGSGSRTNCYDNVNSNCLKYGKLYFWEEALYTCPAGWHLPSLEEYQLLIKNTGGYSSSNLKSSEEWNNRGGSDAYGFSILPAGYFYQVGSRADQGCMVNQQEFRGEGRVAVFWTSTKADSTHMYYVSFGDNVTIGTSYLAVWPKSANGDNAVCTDEDYRYSVRCVKD